MAKAQFEIVIQDPLTTAPASTATGQSSDAGSPAPTRTSEPGAMSPQRRGPESEGAGSPRGGGGSAAASSFNSELGKATKELSGFASMIGAGGLVTKIAAVTAAAGGLAAFLQRLTAIQTARGLQAPSQGGGIPFNPRSVPPAPPRGPGLAPQAAAAASGAAAGRRTSTATTVATSAAAGTAGRAVAAGVGSAASGGSAAGAAGAGTAAAAEGSAAAAGGVAAAALNPITLAIVAAVAAIGILVVSIRRWNSAMTNSAKALEQFSPELTVVQGRGQIRQERLQFEAAQRLGGLLARRQDRGDRLNVIMARTGIRINESLLKVNEQIARLLEPVVNAMEPIPEHLDVHNANWEILFSFLRGDQEARMAAQEKAQRASERIEKILEDQRLNRDQDMEDPFADNLFGILNGVQQQRRPRGELGV